MAKLKPDPITQFDLIDFLDSDFSFELQVLNTLTDKGFSCEHSGPYTDRATKKTREYDIRATKVFAKRFLRLAVECKNLRQNYPLLVSCVPRRDDEAFHEIAISVNPDKHLLEEPPEVYSRAMLAQSKNIRLTGERSLYKAGEPVGKSCHQVGRLFSGGDIIAENSDIYAKWSQALSSADDLTHLACSDGNNRTGDIALSLIFPLLVVPNGRLWMTQYDADGNRIKDPEMVDRCSYFVHLSYYHRGVFTTDELTISHLEFVTVDGLLAFVDELSGDDDKLDTSFPIDYVTEWWSKWERR